MARMHAGSTRTFREPASRAHSGDVVADRDLVAGDLMRDVSRIPKIKETIQEENGNLMLSLQQSSLT